VVTVVRITGDTKRTSGARHLCKGVKGRRRLGELKGEAEIRMMEEKRVYLRMMVPS
jgi:hypothetical protein